MCYNVEDLGKSLDETIAKRLMNEFKKIACKSKTSSKPTAFFKHGPTPPDGWTDFVLIYLCIYIYIYLCKKYI